MKEIKITRAKKRDAFDVYQLAISEDVRAASFDNNFFYFDSHLLFFELCREHIYIIKQNNKFCGYVRFDIDRNDSSLAKINIAIESFARGKGIAAKAVKIAINNFLNTKEGREIYYISAEVKSENEASKGLFGKLFRMINKEIVIWGTEDYREQTEVKGYQYIYTRGDKFQDEL